MVDQWKATDARGHKHNNTNKKSKQRNNKNKKRKYKKKSSNADQIIIPGIDKVIFLSKGTQALKQIHIRKFLR